MLYRRSSRWGRRGWTRTANPALTADFLLEPIEQATLPVAGTWDHVKQAFDERRPVKSGDLVYIDSYTVSPTQVATRLFGKVEAAYKKTLRVNGCRIELPRCQRAILVTKEWLDTGCWGGPQAVTVIGKDWRPEGE